jgi:inorganic pyrophosphatase
LQIAAAAYDRPRSKFKCDPALEVFTLNRALILGVTYPFDWGFVPSPMADDGDPLDVMI